ncbi:MAG TPA: hypothetical protein VMF31_03290 [Solirubrobacterales bacterium]|nr:hypothetical protein [Solirubrobacterales bacterium]
MSPTPAAKPIQQHTFRATVAMAGVNIEGSFDKFDGGDLKAESKAYRPGGMESSIVLPAPQTTEAITVTRFFDAGRDLEILPTLRTMINQPATITVEVLGPNKTKIGKAISYTGNLSGIVMPKFDSTSDGAVAEIGLTFTIADQ